MTRVTLRDGMLVTVRPIQPEDEPELTALYARLSPETAYQRFFTIMVVERRAEGPITALLLEPRTPTDPAPG